MNEVNAFMINLPNALRIFNQVISEGEKKDGVYRLGELFAWYDFDGYSCYLGYRDLVLSIYFHSKFSCDYKDEKTLVGFLNLIDNHTSIAESS